MKANHPDIFSGFKTIEKAEVFSRLVAESFDIILAAFPHHIELPEPVHNPKAFSRQCKHSLAAGIFFEDYVFLHKPVPDNHRIRLNAIC